MRGFPLRGRDRVHAAVAASEATPSRRRDRLRALPRRTLERIPQRRRGDVLALGLLGLAIVIYYWPVFFAGKLVSAADLVHYLYPPWSMAPPPGYEPHNTALTDAVVSLAPAFSWVRGTLWNGQLPLWNPYTEFGNPFIGLSQYGLFSPLQLPLLAPPGLFGIETATTLVGMVKIAVAGTGAYFLARRLQLSRPAALFGGFAFMFGGYTTAWLSMPATSATVMLPWLCLAVEWTLFGRRPWFGAAGFAAVMAITALAGHPEVLVMVFIALAAYSVTRVATNWRDLRGTVRVRAAAVALAIVLAVGVAAIMLLPALELLQRSVDIQQRRAAYRDTALPWSHLLYSLDPGRNGSPFGGEPDVGIAYPIERAPWFAGIVTLLLIVPALIGGLKKVAPFAVICLLVVGMSMNTAPYQLLQDAIPFFGGISKNNPILMWSFALAMAGAVGLDVLTRALSDRTRVTILLRGGRELATTLGRPVAGIACAAIFLELFLWGADYNPRVDRTAVSVPQIPQFATLPRGPGAERVAFLGNTTRPLLPMQFGLGDVRGYGQPTRADYDAFMKTVVSRFDAEYASYLNYELSDVHGHAARMLSAANVGWTVDSGGRWDLPPEFESLGGHREDVLRDGPSAVYRFAAEAPEVADNEVPGKPDGTFTAPIDTTPGLFDPGEGATARTAGAEGQTDGALEMRPGGGIVRLRDPGITMGAPFTIATWVKPEQAPGYKDSQCLFSSVDRKNPDNALELCFTGSGSKELMRLDLGMYSNWRLTTEPDLVRVGEWHYVVVSFDPLAQRIKLYLDGEEVADARSFGFAGTQVDTTVGATWREGRAENAFDGLVDEVAVYPQALPGLRIYQLSGSGTVALHHNDAVTPRAYTVGGFTVEPDLDRALEQITQDSFDPTRSVVVDRAPAGVGSGMPGPAGPAPRITRYENNKVDLSVTMQRAGLLVLSDSIYPGWKATVDGKDAEVLRADGLFRAVALPAGSHEVKFSFVPASLLIGFGISLVSLIALIAFAFWGRRRVVG